MPDELVDVRGGGLERVGNLVAAGVDVEQRLHPPVCNLEVVRSRRDEYEGVAFDQRPRNVVEVAPTRGVITEALVVPDARAGRVHVALEGRPAQELVARRPLEELPGGAAVPDSAVHDDRPRPEVRPTQARRARRWPRVTDPTDELRVRRILEV